MARDFIPSSDHEFRSWQRHFCSALQAAPAEYGLTTDEAHKISQQAVKWESAFDATLKAQANAKAATELKTESRIVAERIIRAAVKRIQAGANVTDKHRAALGITVAAAKSIAVATEIASHPVGEVDMTERLAHTIRFRDSALGRKRPPGVVGCELWFMVEPSDPNKANCMAEDFKMAGVSLGFKHRTEFDKRHIGQRMVYQMRWVMRKGVKGRWSPTISGVVLG